jgi:ubiquinol-cytochrome c reductase cytochrome b subunit
VLSIPLVGSYLSFAVFGGEFPGEVIIPRLYVAHVLLIPGILLALVAVHMALLVKQKHTQFPGPRATEQNVVGHRMFPGFAAKGGGFFMMVFAVLALLGGWFQINPIWVFGPYKAAVVSSASQPDFYVGWLDGSTRLWPAWELRVAGITLPPLFWPTVVLPGVMFTLAAIYPFLEARFIKDRLHHNLLQRPRDVPARTALGAMAIAFYTVLWISGGNDVIAQKFDISLNAMTWIGRVALLVAPPVAFYIVYRICLGLQQHDREVLAHGVETGIIKRLPSGAFIEVHQPLAQPDEHGHVHLEYAGAAVPKKMNKVGAAGRAIRGFFVPVEKPSVAPPEVPAEPAPPKPRELTGASASDRGESGT